MADPIERIKVTPKRARTRLCKAEMWLAIAGSHAVNDMGMPMADGSTPPFAQDLIERYGLKLADIQRLAGQMADELERRALRAGYDEAWD